MIFPFPDRTLLLGDLNDPLRPITNHDRQVRCTLPSYPLELPRKLSDFSLSIASSSRVMDHVSNGSGMVGSSLYRDLPLHAVNWTISR